MPTSRPVCAAGAAPLRVAAVALVVLTSGCASSSATQKRAHPGSGTASAAGAVQQITVTTGRDYRFHPSTITAHPGPLQVILANGTPSAPHDLQVTGVEGAYVPLAQAGQTTRATFTVPGPGRYSFVCTIHIAQGQTGTLVVRAAP